MEATTDAPTQNILMPVLIKNGFTAANTSLQSLTYEYSVCYEQTQPKIPFFNTVGVSFRNAIGISHASKINIFIPIYRLFFRCKIGCYFKLPFGNFSHFSLARPSVSSFRLCPSVSRIITVSGSGLYSYLQWTNTSTVHGGLFWSITGHIP